MNKNIATNIGAIHDIRQFDFIGEIEDYFYKQKEIVDVELIQGRETDGLLHLKLIKDDKTEQTLNYEETFELVNKVFHIRPDEIYVNFAGHIVYFIVLLQNNEVQKNT